MYDIFEKLLQEHGITAYKVAKETGIATSTLSDWKKGRSTPKQDKLQKIANYFGVTLAYLNGTETHEVNKSESTLNKKEKLDIEKEAQRMIDNIDKLDTVEFCGTPADEDDKEYLKLAYEKFLTDVRIYNKKKYTPNKYKK